MKDENLWRRVAAWLGVAIGLVLGGIGIGALLAMGPAEKMVALVLCLLWFGWSVNFLAGRRS